MADELEGIMDKAFYAASVDYLSADKIAAFRVHVSEVAVYVGAVMSRIKALDAACGPLKVLELGAGTCLTSLMVKKALGRGHFTCSDISATRMSSLATDVAKMVGTDLSSFEFQEADFTNPLPFDDGTFNLVLFDGALHHSRNIWTTLKETRRVTRPGGAIAALREAYLSRFTYQIAIRRLLKSPEFAAGVAENAYLKEQYEYYFRACGLQPEFIPVFSNLKWRALSLLNGLVISKYDIWAKV